MSVRDHFAFESKTQVEKLINRLASNSIHVKSTAFLDQYFDTHDGLLALNHAWLKKEMVIGGLDALKFILNPTLFFSKQLTLSPPSPSS